MKILTYLILILTVTSVTNSQSSIVFDAGTIIEVTTGADICADVVTINGSHSGNGTLCNGLLPVELSSFTAKVQKNNVLLLWTTEMEVSNYGFGVQRLLAGIQSSEWKMIGFVQGYGNSNSPKKYEFTDKNPIEGSKFKYRLKQIDTDGKFEYSEEIEVEIVPTVYALYQNYPNPFNPVTKIRYQLPEESRVVIKLYDLLGAEIMELLNEKKDPGTYEVEFNGKNLPSGSYVYRFSAGNFVETKKMVLMK